MSGLAQTVAYMGIEGYLWEDWHSFLRALRSRDSMALSVWLPGSCLMNEMEIHRPQRVSVKRKFIIAKGGGGGHRASEQLEGVLEKIEYPSSLVFHPYELV